MGKSRGGAGKSGSVFRIARSGVLKAKAKGKARPVTSGLKQDWICGRPCNPYARAPEEDEMPWRHPGLLEPKNNDQPSDGPAAPEGPVWAKVKRQQYLCIILLLGFVGTTDAEHYPHQPFKWVLRHLSGDKAIQEAVVLGSPSFKFKLRDIFPSQMGFPNFGESSLYQTYWCPASNPGKSYCNYPGYGYCGYWGCETIVTSDRWQPQQPDMFLQVNYAPSGCREPKFAMDGLIYTPRDGKRHTCTSYNMTILQPMHKSWATGKVWSVFVRAFRDHWVNIQIIRLPQVTPISLGPNPILAENRAGKRTTVTVKPTHGTHTPNSTSIPLILSMPKPASYDPFFNMLNATFFSLNQSNPDLTESCWLCYDAKPPFYEGVALNVSFNYSTLQDPPQCRWDTPRRGITLNQITGRGKCLGNATVARQKGIVCDEFTQPQSSDKWAIPSGPGMWVCQQSGVSPCVYLDHFNFSVDFCVQVLIVPRVLYHREEEMYLLSDEPHQLHKREVVTSTTFAELLGLGASGTGTGVSALTTQHQGLSQLQATVDEDLQKIEESISLLEKSLSSPSEVILQNRQGLDLLLMQQEGLCVALKEECCFYADHTGVVRDSMAELRERLASRKKERESQQGWFESLFSQSPWLTTLISTLIGPCIMILLALIFGPCILNKLVSFVRNHLDSINIMLVERRQVL